MTTATATPTRTVEHAGTHRLNGANLLRSEAIKVTTLRSTWWSLGIALVLSLAISCLIAASSRDFPNPLPPISAILSPTQFTMLVAGILGAIVITGEYSTGMIRSTLTAEPRRGASPMSASAGRRRKTPLVKAAAERPLSKHSANMAGFRVGLPYSRCQYWPLASKLGLCALQPVRGVHACMRDGSAAM